MKNEQSKVVKVNNLVDEKRKFDIHSLLTKSSDCIFCFSGSYKSIGDKNVLVERESDDVDFNLYTNMETNEDIKVPAKFCRVFEESNRVFVDLVTPISNESNDELYMRRKKYKKECADFVKTFASSR